MKVHKPPAMEKLHVSVKVLGVHAGATDGKCVI